MKIAKEEQGDRINQLIQDLHHEDRSVRERAFRDLEKAGVVAVGLLIWVLREDSMNEVRRDAARLLGKLGDKRALEPLIDALREDEDYTVRQAAGVALGRIGKPATMQLIPFLKDSDPKVREFVAITLGFIRDSRAAKPLIPLISDEDPGVRRVAGSTLHVLCTDMGADFKPIIPNLIPYMKNEDSNIRMWAAFIIEQNGSAALKAKDALLELLADSDTEIRAMAVRALSNISKPAKDVVEAFIRCLQDKSSLVRGRAIRAFEKIGEAPVEVIDTIIALLKDSDAVVRWSAADALAELGNPRAVKFLKEAWQTEHEEEVWTSIRWAVEKLEGKD